MWLCVRLDQRVILVTKLVVDESKIRIIDQQTKKLLILIANTNYNCCIIQYFKRKYAVRCLLIRIELFSSLQIGHDGCLKLNKAGKL